MHFERVSSILYSGIDIRIYKNGIFHTCFPLESYLGYFHDKIFLNYHGFKGTCHSSVAPPLTLYLFTAIIKV